MPLSAGAGLTVTDVVLVARHAELGVLTVTVYMPVRSVAPDNVGVEEVEVKPDGPLHE